MDDLLRIFFPKEYAVISFKAANELEKYTHAAHCCIYAINPDKALQKYPAKAAVMMQNRFDGSFGFPGGLADKEKCIVTGLNRELQEEINLNLAKFAVKEEDHVLSLKCTAKERCYHFFQKQVSMEEFKSIEKDTLEATEYGHETMGMVRVPLFIRRDGVGGLPTFLANVFCIGARYQLLYFLLHNNILTHSELANIIDIFINKFSEGKDYPC